MRAAALVLCALLVLTGCSGAAVPGLGPEQGQGHSADPDQVDAVEAPELGACRDLTAADIAQDANATETVPCSQPHTAQTYAVGPLPDALDGVGYTDRRLAEFAYRTCSERFRRFVGADESIAMRTVLSWAWFRPSEDAWRNGARWYRCDVVGGGEQSRELVTLPTRTRGLLLGRPEDRWMVCAAGPAVSGSVKVPCSQRHDWRAVSTVVLGEPDERYPGDRVVEVRTRDFCSDQVGAYLEYPVNFDFGYTWFHRAEWEAGNRRSVCWARTDS